MPTCLLPRFSKDHYRRGTFFFFFFNPFTDEVIFLPRLKSSCSALATFSSAPTSPDCFVLVPDLSHYRAIWINVYSHADKTWKTHDLVTNDNLACAKAVALDHNNISWSKDLSRIYLLECDGDLLLVHLSEERWPSWHKLDWLRVSRLEGRAMFLGETSFCLSAGGETGIIANRVYYHRDGVPDYQTLDLRSFDEYDSRYRSYSTWQKERKREAGNAKIYGCCRKSLKIIWIQPPQDF